MLHPERDDLSLFASGTSFDTPRGSLVVDRIRRHHGAAIVLFEGLQDRTQAEELRGIVPEVDPAAGRVVVDVPEGWWGEAP